MALEIWPISDTSASKTSAGFEILNRSANSEKKVCCFAFFTRTSLFCRKKWCFEELSDFWHDESLNSSSFSQVLFWNSLRAPFHGFNSTFSSHFDSQWLFSPANKAFSIPESVGERIDRVRCGVALTRKNGHLSPFYSIGNTEKGMNELTNFRNSTFLVQILAYRIPERAPPQSVPV